MIEKMKIPPYTEAGKGLRMIADKIDEIIDYLNEKK